MTRDETVALFLECEAKRAEARAAALAEGKGEYGADAAAHEAAKAHWNAWAEGLLAGRKAMEADGRWAVEIECGSLEPRNEVTRAWMESAKADFAHSLFVVKGAAESKMTAGEGNESKDGEQADKSIQLGGDNANFIGFIFPSTAWFDASIFPDGASFRGATFLGHAWFLGATFSDDAWFRGATFSDGALFDNTTFSGEARFEGSTFPRYASFQNVTFSHSALFQNVTFSGGAWFANTRFLGDAWLDRTTFSSDTSFANVTFSGYTSFQSSSFSGDTLFENAGFEQSVNFQQARFGSRASFAFSIFSRHVIFEASHFGADASFAAIRGDRGFNMADAVFDVVPDFIQAHFEEAPRLDNLEVGGKLPELEDIEDEEREKLSRQGRWHRRGLKTSARYRRVFEALAKDSDLRNIPARWRALKRLAIQGHDTERELEFHARELRSQRFAEDWPLPLAFWRGRAWAGFFRFWFGYFYQWFSDFGRSLARPLIASWVVLIACAAFFLSQTDAVQRELAPQEASYFSGTVRTARHALFNAVPCYSPPPTPAASWRGAWPWWRRGAKIAPPPASNESQTGGLTEPFRSQTNARAEALHLAFRNAFVVLDGSAEAAHRTFGCLYGVELYGGSNPLAIVPSAVSTVSAAQKLFSALMIFLFGLALRNMLKMK